MAVIESLGIAEDQLKHIKLIYNMKDDPLAVLEECKLTE